MRSSGKAICLMLVVVAACCLGAPAAADSYGIIDIGTFGGPTSGAHGVNDFGMVAGFSTRADAGLHAFLWRRAGLVDIGPLTGDVESHAMAINAGGDLVAASYDLGELHVHGLLWQSGTVTTLGQFVPLDISTGRTIVGYISMNDLSFGWIDHAATWVNGSVTDLGTLGGHFSYANALNDSGAAVGMSFLADEVTRRATLWLSGAAHDLGTLGGANSHAYDISEQRHVVGVSDTPGGQAHAFLYVLDAGGNVTQRTDLGTLAGGYSYAYSVSNFGHVVGTSGSRAFVWKDGAMTDLNGLVPSTAGWKLESAWAINDHEQIVGYGQHHGSPHAFIMALYPRGDLNCDGSLNQFDIQPFVVALTDRAQYAIDYPECNSMNADTNNDGSVNQFDIQGFVELLAP